MHKLLRKQFLNSCSDNLKSKIQNLKWLGLSVVTFVLVVVVPVVEAQQPGEIPRIGFLAASPPSALSDRIQAFRQGLQERGYLEGKNIIIEYRYGEGKVDRLPALATELVQLKVNVIVTGGAQATLPAKGATSTIPIVMAQDNDPLGAGFVASLARPGGNITGLSNLTAELAGKQLELLKEIIPRLSRLAVLRDLTEPGNPQAVRETDLAAQGFGVRPTYLEIKASKDIETAFRTANSKRAEALLVLASAIFNSNRKQIVNLAMSNRLPAMYPRAEYVEEGGLVTYGVNTPDLYRRAAIFVDKILKGAKPGDLPVEQPTKFELLINLKTAKQIGLTIPPNVLARADKVIR
jgi:putative ABC transport system substrate-binding protein